MNGCSAELSIIHEGKISCARPPLVAKGYPSALIFAVVMFAVRSSLADWNDVPTGSMKPTILEGDRVFVNKLAYES